MKRFIITIVLGLLILPNISFAQSDSEYNSEQLALRTDLLNFLKEEGFVPELDSDGNIVFKSEGQRYNFYISKTDKNPMYVVLSKSYSNPDDYSVETIVMATKELNLYKGVKVICGEESFSVRAELYVREAEPVKSTFYKLMEMIDSVVSDFLDECENVGSVSSSSISEIPFIITKMEVANVTSDGDIIQGYGSTIYDFKTQYLKPRITIKPYRNSGTYTLYVKLYQDGRLSTGTSSPLGYTYSKSVTISGKSNQVIELSGWGSKTSGNWEEGEYRFEVWYGDYCIGSKKFKVY